MTIPENHQLSARFSIQSCLKKDEFTAVYRARQLDSNKEVVLKTLDTAALDDETVLKRFRREAKILSGLSHPNLIRVLDFGTVGSLLFISFEYFPARSLRKQLKSTNFDTDQRFSLAAQLLAGLEYAHQHQIIHRDIKPANILVNEEGLLKIADFGLAIVSDEEKVTQGNAIVGTPGYMAPEQIQGQALTRQSDLFSSGLVIYELFTGKMLFSGKDIGDTLNKILRVSPKMVTAATEDLPAPLPEMLQVLLQKNAADRPESAAAICSKYLADVAIPQPEPQKSRLNPVMLIVAVGLLVSLLTVAFYAFQSSPEPTAEVVLAQEAPETTEEMIPLTDTASTEQDSAMNSQVALAEDEQRASLGEAKIAQPLVENKLASLSIETRPPARIRLNSRDVTTQNRQAPLEVTPGSHRLEILHDDYPPYNTTLAIAAGETAAFAFALDTLFGYLDCKVHPWANVYLDGVNYGQTPLRELIMLSPGTYQLELKNPGLPIDRREVTIRQRDTLKVKAVLQ